MDSWDVPIEAINVGRPEAITLGRPVPGWLRMDLLKPLYQDDQSGWPWLYL